MYKKHQIVMLDTSIETSIFLDRERDELYNNMNVIIGNSSYQHLYVLSDDKIEKGDWVLYDSPAKGKIIHKINRMIDFEFMKKIIATTDISLFFDNWVLDEVSKTDSYDKIQLPQISQEFVNHFISEYNKGNIITEVDIQYELDIINSNNCQGECGFCDHSCSNVFKLKIDDNNCININFDNVKNIYTREEVVNILSDYRLFGPKSSNVEAHDNWVKKHLK